MQHDFTLEVRTNRLQFWTFASLVFLLVRTMHSVVLSFLLALVSIARAFSVETIAGPTAVSALRALPENETAIIRHLALLRFGETFQHTDPPPNSPGNRDHIARAVHDDADACVAGKGESLL